MVSTTHITESQIQQRDKFILSLLVFVEKFTYLIVLLFFSGAIIGLFFTSLDNLDQENPIARVAFFPVYGLVAILTIARFPQFLRVVAFNPILVLCLLWCGLSFLWSIDTLLTFRRAVALLLTTILGLLLAARFNWKELIQQYAYLFLLLAIISILVVFINPARGIMSEIHIGAWRGLWVEKNYLGGQMSRGLIVMMCAFAIAPSRGWLWVPAGILCFFLVIMSTSKTSLLVSILSIGTFIILRLFRRFPFLRIPVLYSVIAGAGLFATVMIVAPDFFFDLIGKERTLTGRTDIWKLLISSIKEKPLLGYGYGVYWVDPLGPSYYVRLILQWGVPTAHNGWIETWLSVGVVGVVMFAIHLLISIILCLWKIFKGGIETYWAVLAILSFTFFSLSESSILQQNDITWVIYVSTTAKLFSDKRPYWRLRKDGTRR